jgi:hypothetical protein
MDEFIKFVDDFKKESDRAAIILGAAKLDIQLYQILQKVILPAPSSRDDLLDDGGPLGSFNSRIIMAYRLGLITSGFARALHLVRKIRNSFAHEPSNVTLEHGAHRDRIRELIAPFSQHKQYIVSKSRFFNGKNGPGIDFRMAVAILLLSLELVYFRFSRIDHGKEPASIVPLNGVADKEKGRLEKTE